MANTSHESLAAAAAAYLRESAGAVGGFCGIQKEIRRQACHLLKWARKRGLLLTDSYLAGLEKYPDISREHDVYFGDVNSAERRVIKCTKPGKFGKGHGANGRYAIHPDATPLFYLERIELMNREFPLDWRFEGMALGESEFEKGLRPFIVTSQRYIEINQECPHPSEEEIKCLMFKLGFNLIENADYSNWIRESDGIVITDAREFNFNKFNDDIIPIDLIIGKKQKDI